jgi:acetyl esterase
VRVYRPSLDPALPGVVYAHGGGWVLADLELHDATCRDLAAGSGAAVVSVDYRKAPEHPFPAAFDDCRAVTEALLAGAFGVDGSRVAVAGDSAGGNLAAALALDLRDRPSPTGHHLVHQVLIYPLVDARIGRTPSYARFADGFFLTARDMAYFVDSYARGADPRDPRLSPAAAADPAGLPPATVVLAEADPLVDEGRAYAERLRAAGVPVELRVYPGQVHPFVALGQIIGDAHEARRYIAGRLSESFTAPAR